MKKTLSAAMIQAAVLLTSCSPESPETSIIWEEGLPLDNGLAVQTVYVCNPPQGTDWTIWASCYNVTPDVTSEGDLEMKHFNGWYYSFEPVNSGRDTLVMKYTSAALTRHSFFPEGFVLQREGRKDMFLPVEYRPVEGKGPQDSFSWNYSEPSLTDMIPELKKVIPSEGATEFDTYETEISEGRKPGWYRIVIDGTVKVEAADSDGAYYASQTLERLCSNAGSRRLPNMTIEDWPDLEYRMFMLDAGRAFYTVDQVKTLIGLLARYKINALQFHLTEDEGWRVEIDGLPELTAYGAFHRLPARQADGTYAEIDAPHPAFDGSFDPSDAASNTQGFYTREDLVEIIRYAAEHHITVIPEFDVPGHSYAAIMAMEYRFRETGDDTYRLVEPEDESVYLSSNNHRRNALNVALPSTYRFIEKVVDGLVSIWDEAGYPLTVINMGGDEVAKGVWQKSPAAQAVRLEGESNLHDYFVCRLIDIVRARGLKVAGWQEMAVNLNHETQARLLPEVAYVCAWSTDGGLDGIPYALANAGFPVVVCNSDLTYLDLAYSYSRDERGLDWSGCLDEHKAFSLLPYNIYRSTGKTGVRLERPDCIYGTGAYLWGENLRDFDQACYAVFPKAYGIFDRAWNARPDWDEPGNRGEEQMQEAFDRLYSTVVKYELPYLENKGINHRQAR